MDITEKYKYTWPLVTVWRFATASFVRHKNEYRVDVSTDHSAEKYIEETIFSTCSSLGVL
jgi:hypothetical protein